MGDRTWVEYKIGGLIQSMKALQEIAEEAISSNMGLDGKYPNTHDEFLYNLVSQMWPTSDDAVAIGALRLLDNERNYADVETLENICTEHGVSFAWMHGNGGDYQAHVGGYTPELGRAEEQSVEGGPALVPVTELADLKSWDELQARIAMAKLANGDFLPRLTFAPEVLTHLRALRDAMMLDAWPEDEDVLWGRAPVQLPGEVA